jgi:hypothetical protein
MVYLYMIKRKTFRFWLKKFSIYWTENERPNIPKGYKDYVLIGTAKTYPILKWTKFRI